MEVITDSVHETNCNNREKYHMNMTLILKGHERRMNKFGNFFYPIFKYVTF